jgi:hypothetical protein
VAFRLISSIARSEEASAPRYHLVAMAIACLLIFVFKVQDFDIQPLLGTFDDRWFHDYTPYFPGLDHLEQHEVFSPRYANKKKIVLLGASSVDSIGCDSSWSKPDPTRLPTINANYYCSIAAHMNRKLQEEGFDDWRVFNLARNGAYLTPMLYVYARIAVLKPEIVIYGDVIDQYRANNADANVLNAGHYAYLDSTFGSDSKTAAVWRSYRETLMKHGWEPPAETTTSNDLSPHFQPRQRTSLSDILVHLIAVARSSRLADGPPLPVKFIPFRDWDQKPYIPYTFQNRDQGFGYFQGIKLISELQRRHNGKVLFYFSPFYNTRHDLTYLTVLNDIYGTYLTSNGIPFASHAALGLQPIYETYDGEHQTLYGNRAIAAILLNDLREQGLINTR